MPDAVNAVAGGAKPDALATELLEMTERARARASEDPFGNPVLAVALAINRRLDEGELTASGLESLIRHLRDLAFQARAARLAAYVGGVALADNEAALDGIAARLVRPDPDDSPVPFAEFRAKLERTRFAAVFTAHPTFAVGEPVFAALAEAASGRPGQDRVTSHRPSRPTLRQEYEQAGAAILRGRDALDRLNQALLLAGRSAWPDRWVELAPRAIILASWVGYDTDGRTDIGWYDTLRLRLDMKRRQLARLAGQVARIAGTAPLRTMLDEALQAVTRQIEACPDGPDPTQTQRFAVALIEGRTAALVDPAPLLRLFAEAIAATGEPDDKLALAVARAGLASHGLSLAHTHVRLNATQLHNAVRVRLGLENPPADRSRRRVLLSAINLALDSVEAVPVDFGALLAEQASATRLMMTVAQIGKHIDAVSPMRFLIAETESGYTLLCALWLARRFGIEDRIEISPLFETAEALEHGARIIEEALRSRHYRDYLQRSGRLALQFGYSDSGRYVGQLAASYLIERLRLKVVDLLVGHELAVEVILFDTHGESIGRGAHPGSLLDRLKYLSPAVARQAFARARLLAREESAFQGGDGYLLFGSPEIALATIARIARHAFASVPASTDPIYREPDFAADFFASIGISMQGLVEDPGYASLLGAFGPALLDATGSRPSKRQADGSGGPVLIRHPRELRAIPNNAILQQLGWCANTLQGLGAAASRQPEVFAEMLEQSPRFRRALDFAAHALRHSDLDVLRAVISLIDPGSWLDRAGHATRPGRAEALSAIARSLEMLNLWAPAQAMFRRIQADHVRLRGAWPSAPTMATREMLLHALRIAVIGRIWLVAQDIPEFSPRFGVTREALELRLLQLDVPAALALLGEVFPIAPDPAAGRDYGEPSGPSAAATYAREHETLFEPIERLFALVREIGTAVTHEVGAFG